MQHGQNGEAKKRKRTKIGSKFINFAEIGEYAVCISGLREWTPLVAKSSSGLSSSDLEQPYFVKAPVQVKQHGYVYYKSLYNSCNTSLWSAVTYNYHTGEIQSYSVKHLFDIQETNFITDYRVKFIPVTRAI